MHQYKITILVSEDELHEYVKSGKFIFETRGSGTHKCMFNEELRKTCVEEKDRSALCPHWEVSFRKEKLDIDRIEPIK